MYLYVQYLETHSSVTKIELFSTQAVPAVPDPSTAQVMFEMAFPGGPTIAAGAYVNKSAVDLKSEFAKTGGFDGQMAVYGSYAHG